MRSAYFLWGVGGGSVAENVISTKSNHDWIRASSMNFGRRMLAMVTRGAANNSGIGDSGIDGELPLSSGCCTWDDNSLVVWWRFRHESAFGDWLLLCSVDKKRSSDELNLLRLVDWLVDRLLGGLAEEGDGLDRDFEQRW